jgi:hypothetical protein
MLKHYTFLALALLGGALLFLNQDSNRCERTVKIVRIAEVHAGSASIAAPMLVRTRVVVVRDRASAFSLRARVAELHARLRASVARFQAEECCWLNSLGQNLHGKSSTAPSPAWRDLHYDAQELARILGLCNQEPV